MRNANHCSVSADGLNASSIVCLSSGVMGVNPTTTKMKNRCCSLSYHLSSLVCNRMNRCMRSWWLRIDWYDVCVLLLLSFCVVRKSCRSFCFSFSEVDVGNPKRLRCLCSIV